MTALFLSDVHLQATPEGRERIQAFARFLRNIDTDLTRTVYLLGDLFDFWFEYRHVIFSGYFEVLRAFAELRDQNVTFELLCGNHDFWAGRFLEEELGFTVHCEAILRDFGGCRTLLCHGDGLNPRDRGYLLYKRFARAPWVIGLFRKLHPDRAMAIAQRVSRSSRRLTGVEEPSKGVEAQALEAYAERVLGAGEADAVICGHAHAPLRKDYPAPTGTGLYLNTGDWFIHGSYVTWDGEGFALHTPGGMQAATEAP